MVTLFPIVATLASIIIALMTLPLAKTLNFYVVQLSVLTILSVMNTISDALNSVLERKTKGGSECAIRVSRIYIDIVVVIIADCRCVLMLWSRVTLVIGSHFSL